MNTEAGSFFTAEDFRADSLSRKSEGVEITREGLEEARQDYLKSHPEYREVVDSISSPTL